MITIEDKVNTVLLTLEATFGPSHRVYLAGGYLRDLYANQNYNMDITPKDLDFMVVPNEGFEDVDITPILDTLPWDIFQAGTVFPGDYIEDLAARGVREVIMGQSIMADMEAQLIIYGHHLTQDQVAADMDMNICQIACDREYLFVTDAFLDGFEAGHIQVLHEYSEDRKQGRIKRMLRKYPNFVVVE